MSCERKSDQPFTYGGMVDEVSAGLNPAQLRGWAGAGLQKRLVLEIFEEHRSGTPERESRRQRLPRMAGDYLSRHALGAQRLRRHQRLHRRRDSGSCARRSFPSAPTSSRPKSCQSRWRDELSPRNRMIYDSKNYLYYYRLTPDHRMLFGGRAAFFPETADSIRKSAEILRRGMIDVYPQLRDAKVDYVWGGTLDFAFDIMPHAGQMDGMYYRRRLRRPRRRHGNLSGPKDGRVDDRRQAGESICRHSLSRRAARPLQRQALVPARRGPVLQVPRLGELKKDLPSLPLRVLS